MLTAYKNKLAEELADDMSVNHQIGSGIVKVVCSTLGGWLATKAYRYIFKL